jgi:hypothetical protein
MTKGRPRTSTVDLVVDRYVNLDLFNRNQQPGANGCIEWTGIQSSIGYGFIGFIYKNKSQGSASSRGRGMMTTHRLAWMIKHNRLPAKRNINHTCHNKLCVNPDHLEEGTQREKLDAMVRDGIKGGRQTGSSGVYNHKQHNRTYKYSEADIQWIRTADTRDIAIKYGLTRKRACAFRSSFRSGYTWLPCPEFAPARRGRKKSC